jgi:hypothetical protein
MAKKLDQVEAHIKVSLKEVIRTLNQDLVILYERDEDDIRFYGDLSAGQVERLSTIIDNCLKMDEKE